MSLTEKLKEDMKNYMRSGDKENLTTIRLVQSAIGNKKIDLKRELTDEEVVDIIQKEVSQIKDVIPDYVKINDTTNLEKLNRRMEVLQSYLPKQMSEDEIKETVLSLIQKLDIQSKKDMGKLMRELMPLVKGKADGKVVNQIVTSLLPS